MRKWMKITAGGVGIVVAAVGTLYAASEARLNRDLGIAASALTVAPNPALLARGEHMTTAIGKCVACHEPDMGGKVFLEAGPLGTIIAPNLTTGRGGVLASYSDEQLERAIRHGVGTDGRALAIMPSNDYYHLSDADVASIIAYLRTLPPVDRELPETRIGPLGRALYLAGQLPLMPAEGMDHAAARVAGEPGVTAEYGEYLAWVGGCKGCHYPDLAGGPSHEPGAPPAANLTPAGIGSWTEADFFKALRGGTRPDGTAIDPVMPWTLTARMTDDEIRALWMYLRTVPAKASPAE
jgi:cytochrome c553